ncbi:hypothetical protein E2C01_050127 [Portunus trituberculatus]|uniref:Uncharacterized protein n=1 Tax=Portunus trituberculatus TaxID=210409 RepID=A0A5B7GI26_PORTR|nr:hypothetical protein [Portunus trituberculatus]
MEPEAAVPGMQANGGSGVECDTSASAVAAPASGGIDLRSILNPSSHDSPASTIHVWMLLSGRIEPVQGCHVSRGWLTTPLLCCWAPACLYW